MTNRKDILLSICIPTYNRALIVKECVEKCLKINKQWIEIVVVDNCSTDNTVEVLHTISDERLRIVSNEKNIGYVNLMKCLTEGLGEYCMLLGDEDDIFDTDWDVVEKQLRSYPKTTVFQFNYEDEKGRALVSKPTKVYSKKNIDSMRCFLYKFPFAGGVILKKEALLISWEKAYRPEYLWSLYSEAIVPMYAFLLGEYRGLDGLNVRRTENRNNKSHLDISAWKGKGDEPYWTIHSRAKQNAEWIEVVSKIGVEDSLRKALAQEVIRKYMREIGSYYYILNVSDETDSMELFLKQKWILDRDREVSDKEWKKYYHDKANYIKGEYKKYFPGKIGLKCQMWIVYNYMRLIGMFLWRRGIKK